MTRLRPYKLLQKLAALVPIALLLVYLPAEQYLRCRIDGSVRAACCCAEAQAPANQGPIARAQDCCDRQTTAGARPVVEAPGATQTIPAGPPVPATAALAILAPPAPRWARAFASHGPPRGGPPVILLKQAFLI